MLNLRFFLRFFCKSGPRLDSNTNNSVVISVAILHLKSIAFAIGHSPIASLLNVIFHTVSI